MTDPANPDHSSTTLVIQGEALKSLEVTGNKVRVGAYAIRYSGPNDTDLAGDYFTPETDFGPRNGDGTAALFHHGMSIKGAEPLADMTFGPVKATKDENGVFASTELDLSNPYEKAIADLCEQGKLKWSSGSSEHMVRKADDGRILRWHPIEFSFTPAPVEPKLPSIRPMKALEETDCSAIGSFFARVDTAPRIAMPEKTPEQLKAERDAEIKSAVKARELVIDEISSIGEQFRCMDAAKSFIRDEKSVEDFRKYVMSDVLKARPVDLNAGMIGMDEKDLGRYSVLKAIRDLSRRGKLEGLELEAHNAAVKALGRDADLGERANALGLIIPEDVLRAPRHGYFKAQTIGSATGGGFTMQPQLGPMIELLRNKMRVAQAGATMLGGLTGDVYLPQHVSGATAYWVSETGALTDSQSVFAQKKLTPHRVGSTIPYTTQFLAQTSIDAESFVRDDATKVIALAKDKAALHGTGADGQPLGIALTSGINQTVTYGGAATWLDVVAHETGITSANADIGDMAFILDALTVGKWKTILRSNVAGAKYLVDDDMTANGFDVLRSNQVVGSVSFFGVWEQFIMASWSGLEVIVDPYALKKSGQVEITFNELVDQLVRQPAAFNVSTDSAAQ